MAVVVAMLFVLNVEDVGLLDSLELFYVRTEDGSSA